MSQENVEIVRLVYEVAARGDDAATVLALYDPEVEWDISHSPARELMGHRVYRGHSVWTIRGGKILRVAWFGTRADALREVAGLSE